MNGLPIGVFDSGIGGLTVVKEIIRQLPNESLIYLGDTARVPYGIRGKEVITQFALELTQFLLQKKIKFLVVACNTISATALEAIQAISSVPVLGVIEPAVGRALEVSKNRVLGVIGTSATISSGVYESEIKKLNPKFQVLTQACPLFVPLAEEGLTDHSATKLISQSYLEKFNGDSIDTLVLGCTHYPLLSHVIQKVVGKGVVLVDSAEPTARKLKEELEARKLLNGGKKPRYQFYVTDAPERVNKVAERFFGKPLPGKLQKISVDGLAR